jgi:hypothetical protein
MVMKKSSESTFVQYLDPIVEHFLSDNSKQPKFDVRHKPMSLTMDVTFTMVADAGEATFPTTSLSLYPLDPHCWPLSNILLIDM